MKFSNRNIITTLSVCAVIFTATSCRKDTSSKTGWAYNDPEWDGFEAHDYAGQETGPGLVLVEGGSFHMGSTEQDVLYEYDNIERTVTVMSFYMDETEISNLHYLEYLHWLYKRYYGSYPNVYYDALPDTNIWREKLAYNEPLVKYYFRHPAYQDYPVVGVDWLQATAYAAWRTDRVNEMILIREGILEPDFENQVDEETFNTDAYLGGIYTGTPNEKGQLKDIMTGEVRQVKMEDGILLPEYRLPTEAEWEYAAKANIGNSQFENINVSRIYPWNGLTIRQSQPEKNRGEIMANLQRGRGDQGGIAGKLNDAGIITTPVISYWPNDYGLYNMAGNVSEWVMDVYRPLSWEIGNDMNTFRGNVFDQPRINAAYNTFEKDSLGRVIRDAVNEEDNVDRRNYRTADNIGYRDELDYQNGEQGYEYGATSLIDNRARVYKGGSWDDRAYWMSPGTRRYLDEQQSLSTLGFRCCMTRLGAPNGNK